jgi:hypothetical protein
MLIDSSKRESGGDTREESLSLTIEHTNRNMYGIFRKIARASTNCYKKCLESDLTKTLSVDEQRSILEVLCG